MEYMVEIRLDGEMSERQIYYLLDKLKNWGPVVGSRAVVVSLDQDQPIDRGEILRHSPGRALKLVLGRWIATTGDRGDYPEVESIRVIPEPPEEES